MHDELRKYIDKHNDDHNSKMKKYYDQHPKTPDLKIGNIVFVKEIIPPHKFKKFAPNFEGPYIITELQEHQRILLKHLHTNKAYPHPLHISRLKLTQRYQMELAYKPKGNIQ